MSIPINSTFQLVSSLYIKNYLMKNNTCYLPPKMFHTLYPFATSFVDIYWIQLLGHIIREIKCTHQWLWCGKAVGPSRCPASYGRARRTDTRLRPGTPPYWGRAGRARQRDPCSARDPSTRRRTPASRRRRSAPLSYVSPSPRRSEPPPPSRFPGRLWKCLPVT